MPAGRKRYLLAVIALIALGVVGLYLWYVRGVGIRPQIGESPGFRWELRAHMPKARTEVAVAAWRGRIFVIGGFDGFARTTSTVQVYDPTTDTWTMGPPLPRAVHHAMAAAIGDRLYLVGGFSGVRFAPSDRVFAFDGSTWREVAPLPEPLGASGIAVLDGRIHVVSGQGRGGNVRSHYVYDPGRNLWGREADLEVARDHLALAALNGKLYAIGGRLGGKISRNLAVVEVYDLCADAWSRAGSLVKARSGHTAAVLGGRIYVFGGEEPRATIRPVEVFDGRSWSVATSLPTPRHGLGSCPCGRDLCAVGWKASGAVSPQRPATLGRGEAAPMPVARPPRGRARPFAGVRPTSSSPFLLTWRSSAWTGDPRVSLAG